MKKRDYSKMFVHGERIASKGSEKFSTIYPGSGEVFTNVDSANAEDIESAVQSSQEGFQVWSQTAPVERARVLARAASILRSRNQELAEIEVLDTGKPISEANTVDVISGADCIEYYAGLAQNIHGQHTSLGKSFFYTKREPLGICLGIGAWNYPLQIACWKAAPALACGNAMVFKPSELTPLSAPILAEIFQEAGLPPGVFNVVQGNAAVGKMLTSHKSIAKVSLTGSVATGKKVLKDAAEGLKHTTMELGGKSPLVIFDDCDLNQAVTAACLANFYTQGEVCSNGTRVFVHESIHGKFVELLLERMKRLRVGNPFAPETNVGALISEAHLTKVVGYVETGKREGAKLLVGGERAIFSGRDVGLNNGFFFHPAVFTECQDEMKIVQEEIFGPVMSVLRFQSEEEVIARANATEFGLAASVFTKDLQRAHRVIGALQAGTCWINNYNLTPIAMPFGGYKQSGLGRENGQAGIDAYTQLKSVYVEMDSMPVWP